MPSLTTDAIAQLLQPYIGSAPVPPDLYGQLHLYLELILKWNTRINLTAIRDPEQIVRRHFGESLFAGLHLDEPHNAYSTQKEALTPCNSLLDLGSGAGFPGIPIQLLRPDLPVTLAESRARKAAFLSEVIRTLGLSTSVWAHRAEAMAAGSLFHTVTLRAVDAMDSAVHEAARRATHRIVVLGTQSPVLASEFHIADPVPLPESREAALWLAYRIISSGSN